MKAYSKIIVLLLALMGLIPQVTGISFATIVESEPNNKTSPTPVTIGEQFTGKMDHALDYDWYSLEIAQTGDITISAYFDPPEDAAEVTEALRIELRNLQNQIVEQFYIDYSKPDNSNTLNFNINQTGQFYVVAFSPNQSDEIKDNYYITLDYSVPPFISEESETTIILEAITGETDTEEGETDKSNVKLPILKTGTGAIVVKATVEQNSGQPVPEDTKITFKTDKGMFPNGSDTFSGTIPSGGEVHVALLSGTQTGMATITCTSGNTKKILQIEFTAAQDNTTATLEELAASPPTIPADGKSTIDISALFYDKNDNPVPQGTEAVFYATRGSFTKGIGRFTAVPTDIGIATVSLRSSTIEETSYVIGYSQGIWKQIAINFGGGTDNEAAFLSLSTSKTAIKTNGSDSAVITAKVLDASKVPIDGAIVKFTTTGGQISTSSTPTDANGNAVVELSSGSDKENQTITLTASVDNLDPASIPIQLSGSSVSLDFARTSLQKDISINDPNLTIILKDGSDTPVYNQKVTITQTGTGSVTFPNFVTAGIDKPFVFNGTAPPTIVRNDVGNFISDGFSSEQEITISGTYSNDGSYTIDQNGVSTKTLTLITTDSLVQERSSATISCNASRTSKTGYTGLNGTLPVIFEGEGGISGNLILAVTALGTTTTQAITVSGEPFEITKPSAASDSISKATNDSIEITVRSTDIDLNGNPDPVKFSTTMGFWSSGKGEDDDSILNSEGDTIITIDPGGNKTATAEFNTGETAGIATIKVENINDSEANDSILVAISAPSDEAAKLSLQVSPSVIPPSTGDVSNVATLKATVKNQTYQVVSDASVMFTLFRTTGGGEIINTPIVYTGEYGEAKTHFTSGSLVSDTRGIYCLGRIEGAKVAGPDDCFSFTIDGEDKKITRDKDSGSFYDDDFNVDDTIRVSGSNYNDKIFTVKEVSADTLTLDLNSDLTPEAAGQSLVIATEENCDVVAIKISGEGSSVSIGGATEIEALNPSTYKYPMSVLVADSNGNPVAGATVNLSVWPTSYWTGVTGPEGPVRNTGYPNEDLNRNDILDQGEDTFGHPAGADFTAGDGQINPAKSTAGTVPATVTTDASGVAQFNYVYQKNYAGWLDVEILATTLVYGSETSSVLKKSLSWMESEKKSIPNSPWGPGPLTTTAVTVPTAYFTATDYSDVYDKQAKGIVPRTWFFEDASTIPATFITDEQPVIEKWKWEFGDGKDPVLNETDEPVKHIFDQAATYRVTLTVTNDYGETDSVTQLIEVIN